MGISKVISSESDLLGTSVSLYLPLDGVDESIDVFDSSSNQRIATRIDNAQLSTTKAKFGTASLYGTRTQYLTFPDSTDWDMGIENFCYEMWILPTGSSNFKYGLGNSTGNYNTGGMQIGVYSTGNVGYGAMFVGNDHRTVTGTTDLLDGEWHHIAFVRCSNTLTLYVDGVSEGTPIDVTGESMNTGTPTMSVGSTGNWNTFGFEGYIDEVRISNTHRYTENFSVATEEHESDDNTLLLLHFNLIDESNNNHLSHFHGTAQLDTSTSMFSSSASLLLDGNSDYLTVPSSTDFAVMASSTTDWTISMFVKHVTTSGSQIYLQYYLNSGSRWAFWHDGGSGNGLRFFSASPTMDTGYSGNDGRIIDTNWHHVSMIKSGTNFGLYLDGTQVVYVSDSDTGSHTGATLYIGQKGDNNAWMNGRVDEVFIKQGNYFGVIPNAGGSSFTVPTRAFKKDIGKVGGVASIDLSKIAGVSV